MMLTEHFPPSSVKTPTHRVIIRNFPTGEIRRHPITGAVAAAFPRKDRM